MTIGFENNKVLKAAAGRDFTILVTETKSNTADTEIFSAGVNKFGQLGIGEISDCEDFTKIAPLSNLMYQNEKSGEAKPMRVKSISCGLDHCMLDTDMGIVFEWGANNRGQLGNKRKNFSEHPLIVNSLTDRTVREVVCGHDCSAVLVESENSKPTSN